MHTHRRFAALTLVALAALVATPAEAKVSRKMTAHPNEEQLLQACLDAGGQFNFLLGHYVCIVYDCDGEGGECVVDCTASGCTATTPSRLGAGPYTLVSILLNGNKPIRDRLGNHVGSFGSITGGGGGSSDGGSSGGDPMDGTHSLDTAGTDAGGGGTVIY